MAAPADDKDSQGSLRAGPAAGAEELPPVPWHFKAIAGFAGIYIALRIVQMLGWIGVTVKEIHNALAVLIIVVNLAAAIWCLVLWRRGTALSRGALAFALTGWYLFLPQLAHGIGLNDGKHRAPTGWQHYIYGVGALLGIGVGAFYRRRMPERTALVVGLASLFLALVAIRAFMTGHGYG
ncbi:MAG: hypothetical protein ACYDCQ_07925 [Dehalococcoidia bacterium]